MSIAELVAESLQLLWPARCPACDRVVPERAVFCGSCNLAVNLLDGACPGCSLPRHDRPGQVVFDGKRCRRCMEVPFPFASATSTFEYGATIADAIVRMKHGDKPHLAGRLARLMMPRLAETLGRARIGAGDLAVPVPLHPRRLSRRGFNQSLVLARVALDGLARTPALIPAFGLPRLERNQLMRTRATRELGRAGPAARLAEVAGAFAVEDPREIRGRRVLLVDDVMTTGATASECAEALLRAGATTVHVFTLARAI